MDGLIRYLLSISASAIICGIAIATADDKSASGAMIRLIAGLIMALTVIAPVVDIDFDDLPVIPTQITLDAQTACALGEEMADREINSIITNELEAYILDKAASVGADIEVELRLEDCRPMEITIRGTVLPGSRQRLQQVLETELGIAKENQQWMQ